MKYRVLMTAITAGLIGMTTAQAKPMQDKGEMFTALDADNNGELSQQELSNMRETMAKMRFDAADTNSDGQIDKDEFMAKAEERAARMFKHMDADENGTLDADEAQPPRHGKHHGKHHGDHAKSDKRDQAKGKRHDKMLERMDSDGNGSVSKAEWDSAMARHHERREEMKDAQ
ncbi:EF-hand domain-containing protein [Salinisphaera sp.]|uniref:EF-hand domain-containing protein n=1 Tax=Salinisphaera sp. TaxID=1914330 RepID=UPI000C63E0A7|nr:EF-hand domain-containing protein [Salinisphaera sp.]MAS09733.1 calcium-binding protein [Salinisphaera sp.]